MYEWISKNNELENEMTLDMSYFWYSHAVGAASLPFFELIAVNSPDSSSNWYLPMALLQIALMVGASLIIARTEAVISAFYFRKQEIAIHFVYAQIAKVEVEQSTSKSMVVMRESWWTMLELKGFL